MADSDGPSVRRGLAEECERLRRELADCRAAPVKTMVGCTRCGRGERARYMIAGLCTRCAIDELIAARAGARRYAAAIVRHVEGNGNLRLHEDVEIVRLYAEIKKGG